MRVHNDTDLPIAANIDGAWWVVKPGGHEDVEDERTARCLGEYGLKLIDPLSVPDDTPLPDLTADDVEQLKGKGLAAALKRYGVTGAGTVDEKKAALLAVLPLTDVDPAEVDEDAGGAPVIEPFGFDPNVEHGIA